jgi:hypothetical protein
MFHNTINYLLNINKDNRAAITIIMIDLATKSMYDSHLMLTLDCSALANSHYLYVNVPL